MRQADGGRAGSGLQAVQLLLQGPHRLLATLDFSNLNFLKGK